MRRGAIFGLVALSACSYGYGTLQNGERPRYLYEGAGWDSGLAYGVAMETAVRGRGGTDPPDSVEMNCNMYAVKILAAGLGGLVSGWAASTGHEGVAIGAGAGTLAVALLPNCFTTVGYHHRRPALPPRPAFRPPAPTTEEDDSDDSAGPDGGAPDTGQPSPP